MHPTPILGIIGIRWLDIIDILLVAFLIYQLYRLVKGTVAIKIFLGILAIYLFWQLVEALQMDLLTEILGQFISVGVIALIIVFQQEIRRFLLFVGSTSFSDRGATGRLLRWKKGERTIELDLDAVVSASEKMAREKTGALIVINRGTSMDIYTQSGVKLDATVSCELLRSIFYKNSPLHDGAVVITGNSIEAARVILPVSERKEIPSHMGMRHRAAVGITENSDSLAIVVSEQTGTISLVKEGEISSGLETEKLKKRLTRELG